MFEPALAALLVKNEQAVTALMKQSGLWSSGVVGKPASALYEWLGRRNPATVQVVDNLAFDPNTNALRLVLPHGDTEAAVASCVAKGACVGRIRG